MHMRVESDAGYRGAQEPRAFWLGERRLEVHEIVDRWNSPEQRYFKCATNDGHTYILRYDRREDAWDLAAFTHARRQIGECPPAGRLH
jgi:hypothetical protein